MLNGYLLKIVHTESTFTVKSSEVIMVNNIIQERILCPHCGHHLRVELDISEGDQNYYEECPACCKEIHLNMHIDEYRKKIELAIDSDDEQVF